MGWFSNLELIFFCNFYKVIYKDLFIYTENQLNLFIDG